MSWEIELQIGAGAGPGEFDARVINAASGGEPVGVMRLEIESLLRDRPALESIVLASAVAARRALPVGEQQLRDVGRLLFDSLFSGPIYGAYRASMGAAQQRGERLRVVLRLTAPELAALPWEALFDSETGSYVCRKEPLVRHVPAPYTPEPLAVAPPLRVLGLVASPRGLPMLDVEAEQAHLAEALAGPIADGLIDLQWLTPATWDGVHAKLLSGGWHVLHFVGHGDYSVEDDQGLIALEGADGRADLVEAERLADLLGEAQPTPRLVVLNSCSSGESGTEDLFSGTAAALVRSGISAVAAMQFTISDVAAIAFARGFYTAIAHGRGVDEATRSGRIAILGAPHTLEWVTPVLYLRGDTTQLFDLDLPQGLTEAERKAAEEAERAAREAQLRAIYERARAELRGGRYDSAMSLLDDLSGIAPEYRDISELQNAARRAGRVAELQEQMRSHAGAGIWTAVVEASNEIATLDPSAADPEGLATRAREEIEAEARRHELATRYRRARAAEDARQWATAAQGYAGVLELDPTYRDALARRKRCAWRLRLDSRWLAAVLVLVVLLILGTAGSMAEVVGQSRNRQPNSAVWWAIIWMFPAVPATIAASLVLRRRDTGVALGCIATGALWVTASWIHISAREVESGSQWLHLLLLTALLGVFVSLSVAERAWQGLGPNRWDSAMAAALLLLVSLALHTLARPLTHLPLSDGEMTAEYADAQIQVVVLASLLIGLPAVALRRTRFLTPALTTMAWFVLAYDLLLRSAGTIKFFAKNEDAADRLANGSSSVLYLLGSLFLVLAVLAGQRRGRTTSPSEPPPVGTPL